MSDKPKNQPVHAIRLGSIKATIWPNKTEYGTRHNVTFVRLYRDGKEWRDSQSFGRDDLLELAKAADFAHSWIREHEAGEDKGVASEPEGAESQQVP